MRSRIRSAVGTSLAALALAAAVAAAQEQTLPAGQPVLTAPLKAFTLAGAGKAKVETSLVKVAGQPFAEAWRVKVNDRLNGDYNAQFVARTPESLKQGDVILMSAYARTIESLDESGEGRFSLVLEQAKDPYGKVFSNSFGVGREWKRFDVPAVVNQDLATTGGQFTIRVGAYLQTLEIGGVEIRKLPPGTDVGTLPRTSVDYAGRSLDAPWRKEAAERIEKIRKGDLIVRVVDAAGNPVAGATVEVKMTRHAFPFGSCYAPRLIVDADNDNAKKYREVFLENFNYGVDEFAQKWPHWVVPETRQLAMDALQWMNERDIPVRGHTMVWPGWKRLPPAVKELESDPSALREAIREHILSVGTALRGKVVDWDVVNEPFINNDLLKILGETEMAEWFKIARQADPTAKLYLNETSVPTSPPPDERYTVLYNQAKMIQDRGGPIDGVGMQAHFGQNVQPPVQLLKVYDRFATLGLPVRITELDIDIADETLQADYYRDFLTASFSHPNINGILIWGFWENAHWRPQAAMYRKDWSPRPIAGVWQQLVLKDWRTQAKGTTSGSGEYRVRGFQGAYAVSVAAGGTEWSGNTTIDADGETLRVTLSK